MVAMASGSRKRRKKKTFNKVEAVKALARERVGTPPPERVDPDPKREKKEKHKQTLADVLAEVKEN